MTSMMYSQGRWSKQNGSASVYHRETAGQGQRTHFQGVVVPINGSPARNNSAYKSNNHVSSTYAENDVSRYDPRSLPPSQTALFNGVPSNGFINTQNCGAVPYPFAEQQAHAAPPLDYQMLLLSLAEDYFAAAHGDGSMIALLRREMEVQRYYKLIATGLGCLEAVLKVSTRG